jgi:hypothetical protein
LFCGAYCNALLPVCHPVKICTSLWFTLILQIASTITCDTMRSMIEETWQQRRADTTFLTDCCCNCQ